jgi:circadian clock protein KaiB
VSDHDENRYILKLYVAGTTARSARAINAIKALCRDRLDGHFELEVIDIYQQPALAEQAQILAVPTLIRHLPEPLRRFIGDLSQSEKVLVGLNLSSGRAEP